jgi:hypothetical protein
MIGIAAPVSNIIQTQNLLYPGTESNIWMISQVLAQGRLFFASCNFISDSILLGFDFFDCFSFPWVLVCLTLATESLYNPDTSSFSWLPLCII